VQQNAGSVPAVCSDSGACTRGSVARAVVQWPVTAVVVGSMAGGRCGVRSVRQPRARQCGVVAVL